MSAAASSPLLELTLTPHRSLPRSGFLALMAVLVAFNFIAGLVFLKVGAWPVVGFLGLDVFLVWFAFKLSYARARQSERLAFYPDRLRIEHRDPWGRSRSIELQPYWLKVRVQRHNGEARRLILASHGQGHVVGSFLAADERERLAVHLRNVLSALRSGAPLPPPPTHPAPLTSIIA